MIEIPKSDMVAPDSNQKGPAKAAANPADVHAMSAAMKQDPGANELSALFSAQMNRKPSVKKDARTRLNELEEKQNPGRIHAKAGDEDSGKQETKDQGQDDFDPQADELAKEVADQILITDPEYKDPDTGTQVRIKIKESILKDAHVHLIKTQTRLKVSLITRDLNSVRVLEQAEHGLKTQLRKNFTGSIEISTIYLNPEDKDESV